MIKVYVACLAEGLPYREQLLSAVSGQRKEKALRFMREEDQVRSAIGSLLIRHFAGDGEVHVGPKGKPYLAQGPAFNLSHAGKFIGIAVADDEVGFDIEDIARCELKIVPAAFTSEEAKDIQDKESFAYAWTRKEAVSKCQGNGVWRPRESGLSYLGEGRYEYEGEIYFVESVLYQGHVATVASKKESPSFAIEVVAISELLK